MSETPEKQEHEELANSAVKEVEEHEELANNAVKEVEVHKKKKFKEVAPYGNYRNYYGYRVGSDIEQDPRFKVLKKEWFEGKDCLDIGCNSGLITINIAKKFQCRTILGVDIDHVRVNDAWSNLRNFARSKKLESGRHLVRRSKIVIDSNGMGGTESCSTSVEQGLGDQFSAEPNLSDIVSFRCGNFVSHLCELPLIIYDTIICLSVTKWVHLNWGDSGLISLFTKIWKHLHPGGILVLEPQPWDSYYKNRLTTETTNANYHSIHIKPQDFQEILLDKVGFRTVEQATSRVSGATMGFDRPVLVFRK
ncbi:hypothetical protein RND81_06G160500 [Saponaria officinalis]|uniref:RNA methyltransferase n=1 Tax=Saponaria officinalis TaxID=3572 RepID=A0AAW1KAQ4_SAPOF